MKKFLVILLLMMSITSWGQQFTIKGVVKDSLTQENLLSATVFLESAKDSTLITYSITDSDGNFNLTGNTNYRILNFFTTFQGYKEVRKVIDLDQGRDIDMGSLFLSNDIESLGDIVVTARKAPVTMKQDTLEFNAKSFNTKADATLEDVIKQLPGVELDKSGKITVNGKEISKILVNGKEFFGDDPQVALKNLPKEIIDKIQVTESKTEEQKLSGDAGDDNVSEINITIDEDKNRGWFSRLTAGAGTDDRYSMSGIVNYFKDDLRISILGSSNNINSPGFSFDEIYDAMGSSAYSISRSSNGSFGINGVNFGSNSGITSSRSAGLNISNEFSDKLEADGNYFFGSSDNISSTDSRRVTALPDDRVFITTGSDNSNNVGDSHRFGARITIKPDTLTSISIRPSGTFAKNSNFSEATSTSSQDGIIRNNVTTNSATDLESSDIDANVYVSRRLKTKGSFVSISTNVSSDKSDSNDLFNSVRNIFDNNTSSTEVQNQIIEQRTANTNFSISPRYRQALDSNWRASVEYNYQWRDQQSERSVFDIDQDTGQNRFNPALSNDFTVKSVQQRPEIGLSYEKNELRLEVNTGYIFQSLESQDALLESSFNKNFNNLFLQANIRKKLSKFSRLSLNYSNSVSVPSVRQLQPVANRTNPLNVIVGNPDLDATVQHNIYLNLSNYDWEKGEGYYMGGNYSIREKNVTAISTTDENLLRTTTYTNIDGNSNGYLYGSYNKSWKKDDREIQASLDLNGSYGKIVSFSNGVQFESVRLGLSPGVGLEYSIRDLFEIDLDYNININSTSYDLKSLRDQEFTNHEANIDITTFWPSNVTMGLRGEYVRYGNVSPGFDNDSFVVIGSLGYKFAKDKAIVKLKAYDIFDQVIGTRRIATDDYVLDRSSLVLTRYFMLSFTYKFSKFGGADPNKNKVKFF